MQKIKQKRDERGTRIQRLCTKLLNLGDRLRESNHRLVWRTLRVRTKMSVKTRSPRSCHIHFRFGSKSLITEWRLNETSQFFRASFVCIFSSLSQSYFRGFCSRFLAKRWRLEAGPSQRPTKRSDPLLTRNQFVSLSRIVSKHLIFLRNYYQLILEF